MYLILNATVINEGKSYKGSVLTEGEYIKTIYKEGDQIPDSIMNQASLVDATGLWLIPGIIDDQVHFRDPGLTYKGDIASESRAAIAGGVTSYMEMPNTKPQTTNMQALEDKFEAASQKSYANYSFYMGATNDNLEELKKVNKKEVCGIKVFMGSSTGNMLVDKRKTLEAIFAEIDMIIATHCEDEEIIQKNIAYYKNLMGEDIPIKYHPLIRSAEACYRSSSKAVELADKYGSRLHILHLSTALEMSLFDVKATKDKKITGEVCVHHLWFSDEDYEKYGSRIKWNPAIKTKEDKEALLSGLFTGKLDVIATDHAPHLIEEKAGGCLQAASGGPLVQHSLQIMLEMHKQHKISKEIIVEKMCHAPAILFNIDRRGYIREGYYADLVLINPDKNYTVTQDNILYKCKWSPLENETFSSTIEKTFLNGEIAYENGVVNEVRGQALRFWAPPSLPEGEEKMSIQG